METRPPWISGRDFQPLNCPTRRAGVRRIIAKGDLAVVEWHSHATHQYRRQTLRQ